MTPEDVYRILGIPVVGALVVYDHKEIGGTEALRQICGDASICGYWIDWEDFSRYPALVAMLAAFIGGFLGPDHQSKGFAVGWGRMLEWLVTQPQRYAWGSCILADMYHDLHQVVYRGSTSLASGVTLL